MGKNNTVFRGGEGNAILRGEWDTAFGGAIFDNVFEGEGGIQYMERRGNTVSREGDTIFGGWRTTYSIWRGGEGLVPYLEGWGRIRVYGGREYCM